MTTEAGSNSNWPPEIEADFEKIRPLGKGAFGIVWLAKSKSKKNHGEADKDADSVGADEKEDSFPSSKHA